MYDVWKNALEFIEQQISAANYSTWFENTSLISSENGEIKIGVKNSFHIKQLRTRYSELITTALNNNNVKVESLDFPSCACSIIKFLLKYICYIII